MANISKCLKTVNALDDADINDVVDAYDGYIRDGASPEEAQRLAVDDVLNNANRDFNELDDLIRRQHGDAFDEPDTLTQKENSINEMLKDASLKDLGATDDEINELYLSHQTETGKDKTSASGANDEAPNRGMENDSGKPQQETATQERTDNRPTGQSRSEQTDGAGVRNESEPILREQTRADLEAKDKAAEAPESDKAVADREAEVPFTLNAKQDPKGEAPTGEMFTPDGRVTTAADLTARAENSNQDAVNTPTENQVEVEIPINSIEHGESAMAGGKLTWKGSKELIKKYASMPTEIPPIELFLTRDSDTGAETSSKKWMVADGSHRLEAAKLRGDKTIKAYVNKEDATVAAKGKSSEAEGAKDEPKSQQQSNLEDVKLDWREKKAPAKPTAQDKAFISAVQKLDDLYLNPELTKPQVRNAANKMLKDGVIDEGDLNNIDIILKDKEMAAEDALDELRTFVDINAEKNQKQPDNRDPFDSALFSNPFFNPALYKQIAKDIGGGIKIITKAIQDAWKYTTKDSIFLTNLTKEFTNLVSSHKMKTDAYGSMLHIARRAMFSSYGAKINALADRTNSDAFKKFMQNTYASVNDATGTRLGLAHAQDIAYTKFINQVAGSLESVMQKVSQRVYTPDALSNIADLIRNPSKITGNSEIHQTARTVIKTLDNVHKYLREAGVEVGEIKDGYYPREFDLNQVAENPQQFKAALEQAYKETGVSPKDAMASADELYDALTIRDSSLFEQNGSKPEADFLKGRVFGKSVDNANHPLNKFLINDPSVSIPAYINRAIRRAEMSRWLKDNSQIVKDMYANGSKQPSERMAALLKEAKKPENKFGDSPVNWNIMKLQMLEDGVQTEIIGDFASYMKNEFGLKSSGGNSGGSFQSWMRTWVTSGMLEKATLSSLGEIVMPAIRSGNGVDGLRSISTALKALITSNSTDIKQLEELGHDLGILSASMNDTINANRWAGGDDIHKELSKNLSSFFKMTGLQQFTEATRVASLRVGQVFVRRMARDLVKQLSKGNEGNLAIRSLGELGVPPAKAKDFADWLVKSGDEGILTAADLRNAPPEMRDMYSRVLQRFDAQTIMRPNKSSRPQWAQDGFGSLVFQLQSYNYSFFENVIKRGAGRVAEAANQKANYTAMERAKLLTPALLMPALILAQYAVGELRDSLYGDPEKKKTTADKWNAAFSRGIPIAPIDPMFNAVTGAKYNNTLAQVASGAGLGGFAKFGDALIGVNADNNSPNTNTAERALAKRTYDVFVEPAASIAMSMAYSVAPTWGKVALAGARQVVGSGRVRNAVVDATVGKKYDKSQSNTDAKSYLSTDNFKDDLYAIK